MQNKAFHRLLHQLDKLTPTQSKQAQEYIKYKCSIETIEDVTGHIDHCPHCEAKTFHKWGVRSGLQRYKCKECHKTFNALSHTSLARLRHKELWIEYTQDLISSKHIRESAKHCNIAISTAFRWRHRMLSNPSKIKAKKLSGIVEIDETYFLKSEKGNHNLDRKPHKRGGWAKKGLSLKQHTPVLIARDRNGNMLDAIMQHSGEFDISEVLLARLDNDVLLCSDSKSSYKAFAETFDFAYETVNLSKKEHVRDKIYHVQNVNAYDSKLKTWMRTFHGVATKYLENYLGWMRLFDREKELTAKQFLSLMAVPVRQKNIFHH